MNKFTGKRVLITGGTSGIGLALADAFHAAGARVAVCARSDDALGEFVAARADALAIKADVTDTISQSRMLDQVENAFGGLDILVNNAGRLVERDFTKAPPAAQDITDELALNFLAPIQLTTAALARFGALSAILFVTSGYALVSPKRAPTYGAAKAGLHGFAEGLRRQLDETDTQVVEVLPPVVDTPATAHRAVRKATPEAVATATLRALHDRKPMALIGATRMLPLLLRVMPSVAGRLVGNS
jgi:uncharacterized oxidoreductase